MAQQKQDPSATKSPKVKKVAKKSALTLEIDRVAKQTGLPASFISKKVKVEKNRLSEEHKAAIDALTGRVAGIVANAIATAKAEPGAEPAPV